MRLKVGSPSFSWPKTLQPTVRIISVEKSSFRAAHYDLHDEADSLLSLTRGRKLWIVAPPGNTGAMLERCCGGNDSERGFTDAVRVLRSLGPRQKSQIFFAVLDEVHTMYLPYGWLHSVVTLVDKDEEGTFVCSMWYMELETDEQQVASMRRKAVMKGRSGGRRSTALQTQ